MRILGDAAQRRWPCVSVLLAAGLAVGNAAAMDWPQVRIPSGATGEMVAPDMTYNGLPMRILRFSVHRPVANVRDFYVGELGRDNVVVSSHRGRTIIGKHGTDFMVTVDLRASGSETHGQIGISAVGAFRTTDRAGQGFPLPPLSRLSEDIVHRDGPAPARTLNLRTELSPTQVQGFYRRAMSARGFTAAGNQSACEPGRKTCSAAYEHSGSGERVIVVAQARQGGADVIAVSMKSGGAHAAR